MVALLSSRRTLARAKGVGYPAPTDADAIAYIARLGAAPSPERKYRIDTFVKEIKAAGLWSKIDCLYDICAGSEADSLLNLKGATFSLSKSGTVAFAPLIGATGDGSTGYLSTQFTPSTAGGNYTRDSASVGVFVTKPNIASNKFALGTSSSSYGPRLRPAQILSAAYGVGGFINNAAAILGATKVKPTSVLAGISRTGASAAALYENGANVGADANASTGLPSQAIWLLRNGANYSDETISMAYIAGGLSDVENLALWAAMRTYLTAVMRPISCYGDSLTECMTPGGILATSPWPAQIQAALGRMTYNGGVAGQSSTLIRNRETADAWSAGATEIFWAGKNNVTAVSTVNDDIAAMVAHNASGKYIVVGITPTTGNDDLAGPNYASRASINATSASTYGSRYWDPLPTLQAANDGSPDDLADVAAGAIPRSLLLSGDATHLNQDGIDVFATGMLAKIAALGY